LTMNLNKKKESLIAFAFSFEWMSIENFSIANIT